MTPKPPARIQSAAGLDAVFSPRSVAIIGASPSPASIGNRILTSLLQHGFRGTVHPVHPRAAEVLGRVAYASVKDIPGRVDLAVIAVPAPAVLDVVAQCGEKGVRGLVVVTAGFRETGVAGAAVEHELGELARRHGMRLVGPNCLGVINADPTVRLHAIFSETPTTGGPVALMTQSGALGVALLDRAKALGLGIGRFASMGNKVDVSGNDLMLHWESDPGVKVILMHLESVGNPRNFVRIARRVMRTKPVVLVKGGRTSEGARAAGSHTGAMVEADALVDAMVEQAGVVRVGTVEELFDDALALALQPLPKGDRIAVVTNSGGPAILITDALPAAGLRLAELSPQTLAACGPRLPAGAPVSNPLDLLAGASPDNLSACLKDLLADPNVDAVVAMATPLSPDDRSWAEAVLSAQAVARGKPLVTVLFGRDATSAGFRQLVAGGVPTYTFPENAARALGAMYRVTQCRERPLPADEPASVQRSVFRPGAAAGWVSGEEALAAAQALGAATLDLRLCATPKEAGAAAEAMGFPVAIKLQADGLVHKTEAGAVVLGLRSAHEVVDKAGAVWSHVAALGHRPTGILVQKMAPAGTEILVGGMHDAKFGPIVTVGLGGIYTEALHDVSMRLAPVTQQEARQMVDSLRGAALLRGVRGEPPKDVEALCSFVSALSRFVAEHGDVAEVEVNPLRVLPEGQGVVAVDARLRLEP